MGGTESIVGTTPAAPVYDTEKTSPEEVERIQREWREIEAQQAAINKQLCQQVCANYELQKRYGLDKCRNATGFEALTCGFEGGLTLIPRIFINSAVDTGENVLENMLASPLVIGAAAIALIVVLK